MIDDPVRYADSWNDITRAPLPESDWISTDEARRRYDTGDKNFTVVDAARCTPDGRPRPRWTISVSLTKAIKVAFYDEAGSPVEFIHYDWRDGRYWRWITVSYDYADTEKFHMQPDAIKRTRATFEPDGRARAEIVDKLADPGFKDVATWEDAPVAGLWLDRPEFGDWSDLSNRGYGIPIRSQAWHDSRRIEYTPERGITISHNDDA